MTRRDGAQKEAAMAGAVKLFFVALALMVAGAPLCADAFGVPKSNLVVEGRVRLPDGLVGSFRAREGTMLTVRDLNSGLWFGFIPVVGEKFGAAISVSTYSISPLADGGEKVEEVSAGQDIPLGGSSTFVFERDVRIEVQVLAVKPGDFKPSVRSGQSTPRELQKLYGSVGGGLCTITCSGVSVGANSVSLACGSCQGPGID